MQPATIRRLLVFGVCLVAVSCLYLVPSMSDSSHRVGTSTGPHDARTSPPGTAAGDLSISGRDAPSVDDATSVLPQPMTTRAVVAPTSAYPGSPIVSAELTSSVGTATQSPAAQQVSAGGSKPTVTAVDPWTDHAPPSAISRLWTTGTDPEQLGVAWAAATDDRGSVWYEVSVNGFTVTTTQQTDATVGWFNDSSAHVVQVRAVDAAGNRGPWSPTLMVTRPSPSPAPEQADNAPTNADTTTVATPTDSDSPKEDNS